METRSYIARKKKGNQIKKGEVLIEQIETLNPKSGPKKAILKYKLTRMVTMVKIIQL